MKPNITMKPKRTMVKRVHWRSYWGIQNTFNCIYIWWKYTFCYFEL